MSAYINGQFSSHLKQGISIEERGYQFADSVYEVIAFTKHNGLYRYIALEQHLKRLQESCKRLHFQSLMPLPTLTVICKTVAKKSRLHKGYLYLQVSRGVYPRQHGIPSVVKPLTVNVLAYPLPDGIEDNQRLGIDTISLQDTRAYLQGMKTNGLLPHLLAKQQALQRNCQEALFVCPHTKALLEGASSNVWIVKDHQAFTPPLQHGIVSGITRFVVMELLKDQVTCAFFTRQEALEADEAFITSSNALVTPIRSIDGYSLGKRTPGPFTKALQKKLTHHVEAGFLL